jgi:asparagine synthase (glutamine-hydrolysing)
MCGIAGFWGEEVLPKSRIEGVQDVLAHRGPDDSGSYQFRGQHHCVTFIHRRLSILDLDSRSAQPFRLGRQVLIFNGEIYNYAELRRELTGLGCSFHTSGDTEVLAWVLQRWGEKGLDRLEGMWAFASYDESSGRLLLCRDRFGEKPLYLWKRSEGLYFSSEVKGLAEMAGRWPTVDQEHIIRYLVGGYKALHKVENTFHRGVWELRPGKLLWIEADGRQKQRTFWRPAVKIREDWSFPDAVDATRVELIRATKLRMRADVPIAFCMSGGVDSNSIISIARRILGHEVHGFTIVNRDPRYDERELVSHSVRSLGIQHTEVQLDHHGFLEKLSAQIAQHDGPVSTISYFIHRELLSEISQRGYKVSISGTGADELFTGYFDHSNMYLYEVSRDSVLFPKELGYWEKYQSKYVRNPYLKDPELFIKNPSFREHIYLNIDELRSWMRRPWTEAFSEKDFGASLLRNRMLNEMFHESVPVILHEDDLNAMEFSIENRSPFLDRQLFETAFSIPTRHLVRTGRTKAVLREALKGIAPKAIINNRRKIGFNAPVEDLLDLKNPRIIEYLLDETEVFDYVKRLPIESLVKQENLPNSKSKFLFNFLNVKIFLEQSSSNHQ